MRDVIITGSLQGAMSREAQAAREKQARVILAQAETEIAALFDQASLSYQNNPTALHLRAMNMLYEGLKENGALMLVPSSAVGIDGYGRLDGSGGSRAAAADGRQTGNPEFLMEAVMKSSASDRQAQLVRLILVIVGAVLLAVGWYRWAN
jgi:hypothetical protein